MLREWAEILVPLILPTALYLGWMWALRRPHAGGGVRWSGVPWLWLAGAGVLLLALFLLVVTVGFGTNTGVYVPPRWTGSHIVPGHFEPAQVAGDNAR